MSTPYPDPIIKPFSNTGDNAAPPLGPISTAANQETGFPILESTPLNAGGIPVTREEFNGALNFYTKQILALASGWTPTFNQAVSDEQGGYPLGAILYDVASNSYQRSLIDNNTFNFITNASYLNDGIHWTCDIAINRVLIKQQHGYDGLILEARNNGNQLVIAPDENQSFGGIFFWPKDEPLTGVTSALCMNVGGLLENKWVPLKTRVTYNKTTLTPVPIANIVKYDTFFDSLNLTIASPYDPVTGIFTTPFTGTFKFEITMSGEFAAGVGVSSFDLRTSASTGFYASLLTFTNGVVSSGSGFAYLKLTAGDTVGVVSEETFTPTSTPLNQLSISWNI